MTAQTKRRFLHGLGYAAFFWACFLVALVATFPYDNLTGFVERRASAALGREVTVERVRPTITGAIRAEGVTLGPSRSAAAGDEASSVPALRIDRATVRVGLLAMLFGGTRVSFALDVADGTAEGRYWQNSDEVGLDLALVGVRALRIPALREKVGLPIKGDIDADIELVVPAGKADEASGRIRLALKGVVIGDGEAKLSVSRLMGYNRGRRSPSEGEDEGLPIPPLTLGTVAVEAVVANGEAEIPRVVASTEDAEVTFEGRVKLREPLGQSRVDTYLTVKLNDAYTERDETVRDIMKLVGIYGRQAKRSDGSLGFRLSGTFGTGISMRPTKTFASSREGPDGALEGGPPERRRPGALRRPNADDAREDLRPLEPPSSLVPPGLVPPSPSAEQDGEGEDVYPSGMPRRRPPPPPTSRVGPQPNLQQGVEQESAGGEEEQMHQVDEGGQGAEAE